MTGHLHEVQAREPPHKLPQRRDQLDIGLGFPGLRQETDGVRRVRVDPDVAVSLGRGHRLEVRLRNRPGTVVAREGYMARPQ